MSSMFLPQCLPSIRIQGNSRGELNGSGTPLHLGVGVEIKEKVNEKANDEQNKVIVLEKEEEKKINYSMKVENVSSKKTNVSPEPESLCYEDGELELVEASDNLEARENDKPKDVVVVDHSLKDIVTDRASKSSSRKLKDDVQYQNENSVSEDIIAVGSEMHKCVDND
ncbi:unnamed protein product [Lactuca saligna]|uniref:Uncharacterized protein n=1 Tax=Lactuca saligna TaxID=75948 RepID=A0AA35ZM40_LACSI|nr:unnamed protein product [Lactuca saligna]